MTALRSSLLQRLARGACACLATGFLSACIAIGERPAYTYELFEVLKDYVPVLRSQAVDFYANSPTIILEREGGIDAFGKVPIRSSNKCGGEPATESCFSIAIGNEIASYPDEYERLLQALRSPCSTFAQKNSTAQLDLRGFKTERVLSADPSINALRQIFGCDRGTQNEVVIHIEILEGLDSRGLELLAADRRPSPSIVPRRELKLIRELTIKVN